MYGFHYFVLKSIDQWHSKNVSSLGLVSQDIPHLMTTLFVELDRLVAFLPIVYQPVVKTKFFFLKPDQKIGRGRSTCQLLLFIIFATIDIIGIMKQNLKSLWIIGNLVFTFSFFFLICVSGV